MRLIDADEIRIKPEYMHDICGSVMIRVEDVARIINEMPTINPQPHWIPCSERPPEEGERVLCTHLGGLNPNRQVIEHIYEGGKFVLGWDMDMNPSSPTFGQRFMGKVIAWMPLPEPYREED